MAPRILQRLRARARIAGWRGQGGRRTTGACSSVCAAREFERQACAAAHGPVSGEQVPPRWRGERVSRAGAARAPSLARRPRRVMAFARILERKNTRGVRGRRIDPLVPVGFCSAATARLDVSLRPAALVALPVACVVGCSSGASRGHLARSLLGGVAQLRGVVYTSAHAAGSFSNSRRRSTNDRGFVST